MNDDAPNFSQSTERRRIAVVVVAVVSFALVGTAVWVGMPGLLGKVAGVQPKLLSDAATLAGILAAFIAAAVCGLTVDRLHRSLWPELPDNGPVTDDAPDSYPRIVQRRMVTTATAGLAFALTTIGVWVWVANLLDDRTDIEPHTLAAMSQGSAFVCGVIAAVLTAFAVHRVHRSLWPETPDEG